ncbi:uncharacterized protein LOC106181479 [Lingula anatina]|uniref:Uncharacterized protein LOC106181479 n=1 Tax=Lingula anatina TaxID=7574 RepID=A0A1S3KGF7_LINAN|nr:uncharacterized protein LOC106181479 [Lingula anatina]|eukprot:XP_013421316.1 uncharacterized protein LOC106181479 [Lingula anatina]
MSRFMYALLALCLALAIFTGSTHGGYVCEMGKILLSMNTLGDKKVTFATPFATKPDVSVALAAMEASNTKNTRIRAFAKDIATDGFIAETLTWDDTILYTVAVSWIACGERDRCAGMNHNQQ